MDIQKLYNQLSQDPNYTDIGNNIQEFANNYFDDDNNTAQLYDLLLNDNSYETFTGNGYESFSDLKKKRRFGKYYIRIGWFRIGVIPY